MWYCGGTDPRASVRMGLVVLKQAPAALVHVSAAVVAAIAVYYYTPSFLGADPRSLPPSP